MNEHVCEGFKGYMAVLVSDCMYKECNVWSIVLLHVDFFLVFMIHVLIMFIVTFIFLESRAFRVSKSLFSIATMSGYFFASS